MTTTSALGGLHKRFSDDGTFLGIYDQNGTLAFPAAALTADQAASVRASSDTSLVVWGDSTAAMCATTVVSATVTANLGNAWASLGLAIARNPLDIVAVSGRSGLRLDQILPFFSVDVAPYAPAYVLVSMGTNDLSQGRSATLALADLASAAQACFSIGSMPVLMTISSGESFSGGSQAVRDGWQQFNIGVRTLAKSLKCPIVDLEAVYIDAASAVSAPLSGYTDGTVHPYNKGAVLWAKAMQPWLSQLPKRALATYSRGGAYNAASNPLMGGSGGTGNGATGTIPAGCTVSKSGGMTVASSVIARTDGVPGNWWQSVFSGAANSDFLSLILGAGLTLSGSQFAVGDVCRLVADIEIDTGHANLLGIDLRLRFNGSSGTQWSQAYTPASASGTLYDPFPALQFRVPEFAIPAGTTSIQPYLSVLNATSGNPAGTVRVGGVSCTKVA